MIVIIINVLQVFLSLSQTLIAFSKCLCGGCQKEEEEKKIPNGIESKV